MSYLALARKYRPRRFEDVMGQDHVVKALSHALNGDRLHPAILLTGTRGVGKTTLARIIAKCLNCETGVSANPCGHCSACNEVDQGRFVDLLEIDAASNTGVDDVRQVIENAQYSPARGRYKVYLIDEVHMLSKSAFNALLKTLEEPPPHVKFILATTDPQKLLATVLSRCLQFNLKRLPVSVLREQINKVLDAEAVGYEPGAVTEIARSADGSMRDALSLVDQAIAFSGGTGLQREAVETMLGTGGRHALFEILQALAQRNGDALLACLQRLEAQAPDYAALLAELATALQRLAILQLLPNAQTDEDEAELVALKSGYTPEDVQLCYQIAVNGRRDLPWAPDPRLGFEMTLLRMLAFQPAADAGAAAPAAGGGQ
ncbi:MAG TPA: DNA polymerase III subunit gamma/tau, partial [Fontimonas sp.]